MNFSVDFNETPTGTYVLLLHLEQDKIITVGKLGPFDFPAGWYTYIGSAFGAGGLLGRIKHHLRPVAKPHWHIDYLRQEAVIKEIWLSTDTEHHEEDWVDIMVEIPGAITLFEGFGSSDSSKDTHLFYFDIKPLMEDFAVGVRHHLPHTTILRAFTTEDNSE